MAGRAKKTTSSKRTTKSTASKSKVKIETPLEMPVTSSSPDTNSAKRKKSIYLLLGIAVILGLLYYFKDYFVVATVNGRPISRMAVVSETEKRYGKEAIDNLVTKELILQEASKKGVKVSKEDVDNEVKKIEDELSSQGQKLDDVLAMQNLTRAEVEENLRVKLYIERILDDQVSVSEEGAKKYFDENKAMYPKDAKYEDQKDQIMQDLKQTKLQEKFQTWLSDLKANAKINYFKTY